MSFGRPAFSSAHIFSTSFATFSFHGGGMLRSRRSWSVMFGFHTPLQSGSLARSAQSCADGGGVMMGRARVGAFRERVAALETTLRIHSAQTPERGAEPHTPRG